MRTINKKATGIFCQLIDKMGGKEYLKIEIEGYMPLTIEKIAHDVDTTWGNASLYSLLHHYIQNGDLMQDPQMDFIVVDGRTETTDDLEMVKIYPYSFVQANMGIYEDSIIFEGNTMYKYNQKLQHEHAEFANIWLGNIKQQCFLSEQ